MATSSTSTRSPVVEIRDMGPGDVSFVMSTWLMNFKKSRSARGVPKWLYYKHYHPVVTAIVEQSEVRILGDQDDDTFIYGWICYERAQSFNVLHYIYVKKWYRGAGLARMLFDGCGLSRDRVVYTFDAPLAKTLAHLADVAIFQPAEKWLESEET